MLTLSNFDLYPPLDSVILYHGPNCSDGHMAATIAHGTLGDRAEYIPVTYGSDFDPLTLPHARTLYLIDISFPKDVIRKLTEIHCRVVILDHHKTAKEDLLALDGTIPNLTCIFDMEHSAAVLAWDYFMGTNAKIPLLVLFVEDYDLWKFELPSSEAVNVALHTRPMTFLEWDKMITEGASLVQKLVVEGEAMLKMEKQHIESLIKEAQTVQIGDYYVPAVNAPHFYASKLGNKLLEAFPDAPFSASYRFTSTGQRCWSLRSENSRVDVSKIAKRLGGGGHRNAAGFKDLGYKYDVIFVSSSYVNWFAALGKEAA